MHKSLILLPCLAVFLGAVSTLFADIEYHFVPNLDGQPFGCAQFVSVAPVVGPSDFKVLVTGSNVGCTPSWDENSAKAYMDKWGLGVFNSQAGTDKGVQGQVQLDGKNGGEYLRLEFPVAVQLTYLTFASVGLADRFELVADGQSVDLLALFPGTSTIRSISSSQGQWPGKVDFTSAAQPLGFAKVWDIIADGPDFGDGFQLENVGVVPEPSTLALLSTGLAVAGLTLIRRRHRACR